MLLDPGSLNIDASCSGANCIAVASIESGLASGNFIVTTGTAGGDITVDSNVALTWANASTLTLSAYGSINFQSGATITNTSSGNLVLRADNSGSGTGTVSFASANQINYAGSSGSVSIFYNPSGNNNTSINSASYLTPTDFSGGVAGSNKLTAYMLVNTVFDLQNMKNKLSGNYALGRNIDASATAGWNGGFAPIGTETSAFTGRLDGQGHVIDKLTINSTGSLAGLFGQNNGTIGDLGLTNISVTSAWKASSGAIYAHVGGLAGINHGSITNAFVTGSIASNSSFSTAPDTGGLVGTNYGAISRSYASVNITESSTGNALYLGGLVGWNNSGSITQSYADGTVKSLASSQGAVIGGLVGQNSATIAQSYATGAVTGGAGASGVGGLVGANNGSVSETYASGAVSGAAGSLGGLVGQNSGNGSVATSYWDIQTTGQLHGAGNSNSFDSFGLTTAQAMTQSSYVGWNFGDGGAWFMIDGQTRPFLRSEWSATISNAHQLQLMAMQPGASYTLANNILLGPDLQNPSSMWSRAGFVPIGDISFGGFTGSFDGLGRTIDELMIAPTIASVNNIGLFGANYGSISNLTLTNVSIFANPNAGLPGQFVGVVAGQNAGSITNVSAFGSVNGMPNGQSLAGVIAGGLVGQNGIFTGNADSVGTGAAIASVASIRGSFANVAVTVGDSIVCSGPNCNGGQNSAGGLVGFNTPNSTIIDSQAIGAVIAGAFAPAGGLVGQNFGTITSTTTALALASLPSCAQGAAYSCAGGTVSVGSLGIAGGLVGSNDGTITRAFASGAVTGAAGQAAAGSDGNNQTQLGGLAGINNGTITFAFATGPVGSAAVAYLEAGGLVAENHGFIGQSAASGAVNAGDGSMAGGLTASSGPSKNDNNNCGGGCIVGTGHDNSGTVSFSFATGNVTVGAASLAGGLSGTGDGTFDTTFARGNVVGGGNSSLGGLIGAMGVGNGTSQILASQAYGNVTGTGDNSIVGGLVGLNGGGIVSSSAAGKVLGTSESYLGGLVGINIGLVQDSTASGTVTGSGVHNFAGGLVGLNFGNIDPSSSSGDVTSGANSVVGGLVGAEGAFEPFVLPAGVTMPTIPGSFPVGTISANSLATGKATGGPGSTVDQQVGQYYPTSGLPAYPTFVNSCNDAVCYILANGVLKDARIQVTVDANPLSKIYGSGDPTLTYQVVSGDLGSATFSGTLTRAAGENVGSYVISEGSLSLPGIYKINFVDSSLTIKPATLTETATASSRTYGSSNPTFSGSITGFVNGDTLETATTGALVFGTTATVTSNVGSYAINGSGLSAGNNYVIAQAPGNANALTITQRPLTVTANAQNMVYGNTVPTLTYLVGGSGLVNGDSLTGTLATTATSASNVGQYAITQGTLGASTNYALTYVGAGLTVNARPITVTADAQSMVYGNAVPTLTYGVGGSGLVNGDSLTGALATTATSASNVGQYAITQGTLGASSNYALTYAGAGLTVNARPITVTADAQSMVYGSTVPTLTYGVGGSGLVNGDSLTGALATSATSASNVGQYAITQGTLGASTNYALTYVGAGLTVSARPITVTADAQNMVSGNTVPTLTYGVGGSGLVNGDSLAGTLATTATSASNAGQYAITQGTLGASTNYALTYVGNNLTIASAPPTPPPPIQTPVQFVSFSAAPTGEVVNTQPLNQPPGPPGPPRGGNAPPPSPGGLPPQFGARFFTPPPLGETHFVQNEVVLQIPSNIPYFRVQSIMSILGLTILGTQDLGLIGVTCYRVHIDNGASISSVVERLAAYQIVAGAQANYTYYTTQGQTLAQGQEPDLASLSQGEGDAAQYTISKLGLIDVHRQLKGGNISVAVIDSQIDVKHPDLDGVVAEQFDAVGAADMPHSHGTGMAGAIFAHRKLMGIAPSARLYAVHAFSSGAASAESTTFNILKGLEWASAKGVRVINMSFAGPRDPSMERALKAAHDKGIVLIAAAGNAGPKSPPLYPGADPNVIAVTATDVNDKIFTGANRGRYIAVAAPGVDILVPAPDNTYQLTTGTSVASAEVSGLVALLLERNPTLGPEDVRKILTTSARRLSGKDRDDDFGSGLVDPSKAIQTAGDLKSADMTGTVAPQPPAPRPSTPARPPVVPVSHPGGGALRPVPAR